MIYRILTLFIIYLLPILIGGNSRCNKNDNTIIEQELSYNNYGDTIPDLELLYGDIWGTIYHALEAQCDDTPTITGDGSKINPDIASQYRWIAITQEMLCDSVREKILNKPDVDRFRGKIQYGDTVWIESDNPNINGWWVVHDTKNKRCIRSIDFLQTHGDGSLYDNNRLWSGKFKHLNIYRLNNSNYSEYQSVQNDITIIIIE